MFDKDLLNRLPFETQLDLTLLLEDPLSPESKKRVDDIIAALRELREVDLRKMPFGLDANHYLNKIGSQIEQIKRYVNAPKQPSEIDFAFEPGGINKLRALVKKHPNKLILRGTNNPEFTIIQPTGLITGWASWVLRSPQPGYLNKMVRAFDKFCSLELYKPLQRTVSDLVEMGSLNPTTWELSRRIIETDTAAVRMVNIDYDGPIIEIPTNYWQRKPGENFEVLPVTTKREQTRKRIAITLSQDLPVQYVHSDISGSTVHVGEIIDTIDMLVYGIIAFAESNESMHRGRYGRITPVINLVHCLGGGKVTYDVSIMLENTAHTFMQIHSDEITTPKAVTTKMFAAARESMTA